MKEPFMLKSTVRTATGEVVSLGFQKMSKSSPRGGFRHTVDVGKVQTEILSVQQGGFGLVCFLWEKQAGRSQTPLM